jgi:hypothetical protein
VTTVNINQAREIEDNMQEAKERAEGKIPVVLLEEEDVEIEIEPAPADSGAAAENGSAAAN